MTRGRHAAPEEPEILTTPEPPPPPGRSRSHWQKLRQFSDRTPLRTKLIAAVLALVIMALVAISAASVLILRPFLYQQRDDDLRAEFDNVKNMQFRGDPGYAYAAPGTAGMVAGFQQPGKQLVPYVSQNPGFPGPGRTPQVQSLPVLPTITTWTNSNYPLIVTVPAQTGNHEWRVIAETVPVTINDTQAQSTAPLVVAVDLGPVDQEIKRLITIELSVGAAILVVVALAGIAVIRANLRPLDDIELTAGQIAGGHLDHRIPERDPRTEIGSLGRSLNTMLSQIETAFRAQQESEEAAHRSEERMRRFIADASHELRTPLTTLRGFAEFYRQRGGVHLGDAQSGGAQGQGAGMSRAELDRIMRRLESEASRMGLLVEDLLQLARLDQQRPLQMSLVDLLTLAADAVQDSRMVDPERKIELTVAPGAAFLVMGDEQRLRQVIGNLVTNARVHTPPRASIRVAIGSGRLSSGAPAVVLDVIDNGPGMTAEQAQRVFERFYRADAARNRASGGTGLGLAIVAGLVEAHGGEVSVTTAPGHGADFTVRLPLSPDAMPSDDEADDHSYNERGGSAH